MRMRAAWVLASIVCSCPMDASADQLRIDARNRAGQLVTDAECMGANPDGVQYFKTGRVQPIRASSSEMLLVCTSPTDGTAIGALRAYPGSGYPAWIEMVFGEVLMFDVRRGVSVAVQGTPPGRVPPLRGVPESSTSTACQHGVAGVRCE
jgi:hypothetical protein